MTQPASARKPNIDQRTLLVAVTIMILVAIGVVGIIVVVNIANKPAACLQLQNSYNSKWEAYRAAGGTVVNDKPGTEAARIDNEMFQIERQATSKGCPDLFVGLHNPRAGSSNGRLYGQ